MTRCAGNSGVVDAALDHLRDAAGTNRVAGTVFARHADSGERPELPARARMRADARRAASRVVEAINMSLDVHGCAGFADAGAPQRIWQDANVAARYASLLPGISYEVYGKALLGITNDVATTV